MTHDSGDVRGLSDTELQVYEAVAHLNAAGAPATIETLTERLPLAEEDVLISLSHLVDARRVHATLTGYVLDRA